MTDRRWSDEDIYNWARETFGGDTNNPMAVAVRMNKEMSELLSALQNGQQQEALKEVADLRIFLAQVHHMLSYGGKLGTMEQHVDEKMDINVKRKWEIGKDGSHQHVEEVA